MKTLTKEELARAIWYDAPEQTELDKYEVLVALGSLHDYSESIYVLLRKDGQLYEYEDSHCSCNGFEWDPQPVTAEYLQHRIEKDDFWYAEEPKEAIGRFLGAEHLFSLPPPPAQAAAE